MTAPLLELQRISKDFIRRLDMAERLVARLGANLRDQHLRAVDNVDLAVAPGEVVGIVGESGCGKSTLARIVAGIHKPSAGKLMFRARDVATLDRAGRRDFTLKAQIVFQDPFSALNPRQRVGQIISEAPLVHGLWPRNEAGERLDAVMVEVGLDPAMKTRYPHQFSGGQRQRVGVARALAVSPDLLVCDEAVAALDVSVQAQILNLFADLREKRGLTYLFISHDLGVIRHLADKVVVMYLGRVMESAPRADLFATPNHPYTRALLEQVPRLDQRRQTYRTISGEIPSPLNPPAGCLFHTRCPHAGPRCRSDAPVLREVAPGHISACHLNEG